MIFENNLPPVISVSTYPGTTAFTLTPCLPTSLARARVKPNTPALLAAYATAPWPPCVARRLATLIMHLLLPSSLPFPKYLFRKRNRVPSIIPVRFVSTICCICSGGVAVNSDPCVTPAQFTSTSSLLVSSLGDNCAPIPVALQNVEDATSPAM